MLRLTLARHGETLLNAQGCYQGHLDLPLSEAGRAQAGTLGRALAADPEVGLAKAIEDRAVFSSDRRRARETAALAIPHARAEPDPRLRELDFGAFEGLGWGECSARFGPAFAAWVADPSAVAPPGGETLSALEGRVGAWLDALPTTGSVVTVAHGGSIYVALSLVLRLDFAAVRSLHAIAPGRAVRLVLRAGRADRVDVVETAVEAVEVDGPTGVRS